VGHHPGRPPCDRGGEPRRGNLELIERLPEREEGDWAYFGRLRHQREKKLRRLKTAQELRPEWTVWDIANLTCDECWASAQAWLAGRGKNTAKNM